MRLSLPLLALSGLLLAGPGVAQSGTYQLFGFGCVGTGPGSSYAAACNGMGGTLKVQTLPNEYAYPVKAPFDMNVVGFELFTQAASVSFNMSVGLYLEDPVRPGAPDFIATATSTMQVDPALKFYPTALPTPVSIKAGQLFWISQLESTAVYPADLVSGDLPPGSIYWKRATSTSWATTGILKYPAYRVIMLKKGAGGTPMLYSVGVPSLGKPFQVDLTSALSGATAMLITGVSKTSFSGLRLPFDLTPMGGIGCNLLVSIDLTSVGQTSRSGTLSLPLPVPNDKALFGAVFHNQWLIIDPLANALNLAFSNGGTGMVGL